MEGPIPFRTHLMDRRRLKTGATVVGILAALGSLASASVTAWSKFAEARRGASAGFDNLNARLIATEARLDVLLDLVRHSGDVLGPAATEARAATRRVEPVTVPPGPPPSPRMAPRPALPPTVAAIPTPAPAPEVQTARQALDRLIERAVKKRAASAPRKLDDLLHPIEDAGKL